MLNVGLSSETFAEDANDAMVGLQPDLECGIRTKYGVKITLILFKETRLTHFFTL